MSTQGLKVLPLKPGVGEYITMHATLTARDFLLANFYRPVNSPAFFPNLSHSKHQLTKSSLDDPVWLTRR